MSVKGTLLNHPESLSLDKIDAHHEMEERLRAKKSASFRVTLVPLTLNFKATTP